MRDVIFARRVWLSGPFNVQNKILHRARDVRSRHNLTTVQTSNRGFEQKDQPTVSSEDGLRTYRVRQHGNRGLPLPAIMDPVAIRAKERHKEPKLRVEDQQGTLTELQKELRSNPYAHALASSVRMCALTRVILPTHFLLPFNSSLPPLEAPSGEDAKQTRRPKIIPRITFRSTGQPSSYLIASRWALDQLNRKTQWTRLVNERMKQKWTRRAGKKMDNLKTSKEWEWNDRMPEMVLEYLQQDALRKLTSCFVPGESRVAYSWPKHEAETPAYLACIIRLSDSDQVSNQLGLLQNSVYDLQALFTPEQIVSLSESIDSGNQQSFVLLQHLRTVNTILALRKLKAFMTTNQ